MALVEAVDGLFGVLDAGEIPAHTADWSNGLVAVMSSGALIVSGVSDGPVRVTVATSAGPPPTPSDRGDGWEEVIEVTVHAPTGRLRVQSLERGDVRDLPLLSPHGSGPYRLRLHARGRTIAPDKVCDEPVEDYLLHLWPAGPPDETRILRASEEIERSLCTPAPSPGPDPHAPDARTIVERERLLRGGNPPG
ncbi:hypothetical protein [Streptomyces alboflavus]|uniref:hypothetical protein n=1 Tax=Streptomyces alboflavus TaxID=67267 RepID=UPI000F65675D|nr:hypothetical protein [Streptomyces alboflavus]